MKKILMICAAIAAMSFTANAQDTLVTVQGKAYLSVVTKVEKGMVHYTRYPQAEGDEEYTIDVHSLREIRFYDGRYVNFTNNHSLDLDGMGVVIDPVRIMPPSYYLKRSANCQFGVLGASFGAGFFGTLGAISSAKPNHDPGTPVVLYGTSIVCGITALVCEIMSIVNLKKAGKSMERIHIIQNGVSLDL